MRLDQTDRLDISLRRYSDLFVDFVPGPYRAATYDGRQRTRNWHVSQARLVAGGGSCPPLKRERLDRTAIPDKCKAIIPILASCAAPTGPQQFVFGLWR